MQVKNTRLQIIRGDITELEADAIVVPCDEKMALNKGLASVVRSKGGEAAVQEAAARAPLLIGEASSAAAGNLPADFVIYASVRSRRIRPDDAIVRHAVASALRCAGELKVRSLALPAVGCTEDRFPATGSAKIIAQEFLKYVRRHETDLREVYLCLEDEETFKVFDQTVSGYVQHVQDTLGEGPYVTVDAIIETGGGIVLIERSNPPYGWALPGGFVDYGETLEQAVVREAKEETNLDLEDLRQLRTYSDPDRDPRFHTISTVFIAKGRGVPRSGDDARGLKIVPYGKLAGFTCAFDHNAVIRDYLGQKMQGDAQFDRKT